MILFIYQRIQCADILLRIFVYISIKNIGLYFSLFVVSLSGFGIRVTVSSYNEFRSVHSSSVIWSSVRRIGTNSFFIFLVEFPLKPSGPEIFLLGAF